MPLSGKVLLITGGTGSFGKKFTRAAGKAHPFKGGMKGSLFLSSVVV